MDSASLLRRMERGELSDGGVVRGVVEYRGEREEVEVDIYDDF